MLTLIKLSKCTLCIVSSQTMCRSLRKCTTLTVNFDEIKAQLIECKALLKNANDTKKKEVLVKINQKSINEIKALLAQHNINLSELEKDNKIFTESIWTIERRLMLLQELGASAVTPNLIVNVIKGMNLPVKMFKAHMTIDPDINLAKNMLSFSNNPKIDYEDLDHLHEKMPMKKYYAECLMYYIKHELQLSDDQAKRLSKKKHPGILYNSFRLLKKMFKIMKNDLQFSDALIIKNSILISHHPYYAETVINMITKELEGISLNVFVKYPLLLQYDLEDLLILLSYLKNHEIKPKVAEKFHRIFRLSSSEFKSRVDGLLKNPFTLVYYKHPRFLRLVISYPIIIPRIQYLEANNLKYATIHSLTTFHNYAEELLTVKRTNKLNLESFFKTQFGDDANNLIQVFTKHPCYMYVPLVQMLETLNYLKEHYPIDAIYTYIYVILYNKVDLETAREACLKDPHYSQLPPRQFLALCVYKIEEKGHFTGEAVLNPSKYSESPCEDSEQEQKREESIAQ